MKPKTTEALAWLLIYSGLAIASLGLFLRRSEGPLGDLVIALGLLGAAAGALLIWLRSRIQDDTKETP